MCQRHSKNKSRCSTNANQPSPSLMDLQASLHLSTDAPRAFPRIGVGDPYERLGLEKNSSEKRVEVVEECLLYEFGSHEASYKSIEAAYDAIMIEKVSDDYTIVLIVTFESFKNSLQMCASKIVRDNRYVGQYLSVVQIMVPMHFLKFQVIFVLHLVTTSGLLLNTHREQRKNSRPSGRFSWCPFLCCLLLDKWRDGVGQLMWVGGMVGFIARVYLSYLVID